VQEKLVHRKRKAKFMWSVWLDGFVSKSYFFSEGIDLPLNNFYNYDRAF